MTATRTAFIAGNPAPQGSKRHVGNGRLIESSRAVGPWRTHIANTAAQHGGILDAGPVRITLDFVMPRPKSTPKTRPTPPAVKRPDVDKLARAVLDAITGVWIVDDSHVVDLRATKRVAEVGEVSGVWVRVDGSSY